MHFGASIRVPDVFRFVIKWVCPVFLLAVFACTVLSDVFGLDFATWKFGDPGSSVIDLIGGTKEGKATSPSQPAQLSIAMAVAVFVFFALITSRSRAYKRAEQGLDKTGDA
jgi:hypothetical protein